MPLLNGYAFDNNFTDVIVYQNNEHIITINKSYNLDNKACRIAIVIAHGYTYLPKLKCEHGDIPSGKEFAFLVPQCFSLSRATTLEWPVPAIKKVFEHQGQFTLARYPSDLVFTSHYFDTYDDRFSAVIGTALAHCHILYFADLNSDNGISMEDFFEAINSKTNSKLINEYDVFIMHCCRTGTSKIGLGEEKRGEQVPSNLYHYSDEVVINFFP